MLSISCMTFVEDPAIIATGRNKDFKLSCVHEGDQKLAERRGVNFWIA